MSPMLYLYTICVYVCVFSPLVISDPFSRLLYSPVCPGNLIHVDKIKMLPCFLASGCIHQRLRTQMEGKEWHWDMRSPNSSPKCHFQLNTALRVHSSSHLWPFTYDSPFQHFQLFPLAAPSCRVTKPNYFLSDFQVNFQYLRQKNIQPRIYLCSNTIHTVPFISPHLFSVAY